jgi:hypothetical protein
MNSQNIFLLTPQFTKLLGSRRHGIQADIFSNAFFFVFLFFFLSIFSISLQGRKTILDFFFAGEFFQPRPTILDFFFAGEFFQPRPESSFPLPSPECFYLSAVRSNRGDVRSCVSLLCRSVSGSGVSADLGRCLTAPRRRFLPV